MEAYDPTDLLLGVFSGVLSLLAFVGLVYILVDETKKQNNARGREAQLVKRKQ